MPVLRKLDHHATMLPIIQDITGVIRLRDAQGEVQEVDLLGAHKAAVLELKDEIVAVQLFLALKAGLERLHGPDAIVDRDDIAVVSGIAIPCAGDVPRFYMGIAPDGWRPGD